jgi:hypothetical protein
MTSSIRADVDESKARIRSLNKKIEVEQLRLQIIRTRCAHPNKYLTTVMGDNTWRCPDCS